VSVSGAQGGRRTLAEERRRSAAADSRVRDRAQRKAAVVSGTEGAEASADRRRMIVLGRMPKGFNINQRRMLYFSDDNAGLDARSYSLTGIESRKRITTKPFRRQHRRALSIPKIFNGAINGSFSPVEWMRGSTHTMPFPPCPRRMSAAAIFSAATYNDGKPVQIFDPRPGSNINSTAAE